MSAQPAIGLAAKFQSAAKGVGNGQDLAVSLQDAVVPAIAQGDLGEPAFVVELSITVVTSAVVLLGASHRALDPVRTGCRHPPGLPLPFL